MNLISVTDLIKQSWKLYKDNFKVLISISAWLFLFVVLQTLLVLLIPVLSGTNGIITFSILFFLLMAIIIAISIVVSIVLIEVIDKIYRQDPIDNWHGLFKPAVNRIGSYLLVGILTIVLVFAGFVLFVVPGIIMAVWYSLSEQVFVLENVRGYAALKRSKELVSGYWWQVLGRYLGASLFFGVIIWVINGIITLPFGSKMSDSLSNIFFVDRLVWQEELISGIISVLIMPLFVSIGVILYNNLKQIKSAPRTDQVPSPE